MYISNAFHNLANTTIAGCKLGGGSFLGFPHWYQYLPGQYVPAVKSASTGTVLSNAYCMPRISSIGDIWLIAAAVIDILLRVGALAAVGFIIYGGIQFVIAQGEPEKANQARKTIINALTGLVISIAAATIVTFVAGSFK